MMYIILIFAVAAAAVHIKKSLDAIEENTSKLREYSYELLEKTKKVDALVNKLLN